MVNDANYTWMRTMVLVLLAAGAGLSGLVIAYFGLCSSYSFVWGRESGAPNCGLRANGPDACVRQVQEAIESPLSIEEQMLRCGEALRALNDSGRVVSGDLDRRALREAETKLRDIQQSLTDPDGAVRIARTLDKNGQERRALYLLRCVVDNPNNDAEEPSYMLCLWLIREARFGEAARRLDGILLGGRARRPDLALALFALLHVRSGDLLAARERLRELKSRFPGTPLAKQAEAIEAAIRLE